jgi:hypothetical protein
MVDGGRHQGSPHTASTRRRHHEELSQPRCQGWPNPHFGPQNVDRPVNLARFSHDEHRGDRVPHAHASSAASYSVTLVKPVSGPSSRSASGPVSKSTPGTGPDSRYLAPACSSAGDATARGSPSAICLLCAALPRASESEGSVWGARAGGNPLPGDDGAHRHRATKPSARVGVGHRPLSGRSGNSRSAPAFDPAPVPARSAGSAAGTPNRWDPTLCCRDRAPACPDTAARCVPARRASRAGRCRSGSCADLASADTLSADEPPVLAPRGGGRGAA